MRKLIYFILIFVFSLSVNAAKITKVRNNKAIIKVSGKKYRKGDKLKLYDSSGKMVGRAVVIKRKKSSIVVKKAYGKMQVGFNAKVYKRAKRGRKSKKSQVDRPSKTKYMHIGSVGMYLSSAFESSGISGGYDFVYFMSRFPNVALRGSVYGYTMSHSQGGFDSKLTFLFVEGGVDYYLLNKKRFKIGAGLRMGMGSATWTGETIIGTFSATSTGSVYTPAAFGYYEFSNKYLLGGEVRFPISEINGESVSDPMILFTFGKAI